jgi:hypothetical protein
MQKTALFFALVFMVLSGIAQTEYHVAKTGSDTNTGTIDSPFLTISKAAKTLRAGGTVIIHAGTYRETVDPPYGGTSDANRVTFIAAEDEEVYVKGSEQINTWIDNGDKTWKVSLQSTYFNGYNPYTLMVDADFQTFGQWHHRGDVYINNGVLGELQTLEQVKTAANTWYTITTGTETTIYANFGILNPNTELTEINVRETVFFTTGTDIDYITISGLRFLHAAPNWQSPYTTFQKGAVGSNMGKGWIIENCEVMYSKTCGIMMGSNGALGDLQNIDAFGDHIIRNNLIHRCGETGISGARGLSRSAISGNRIEDINYRKEFGGWETAGIKVWVTTDLLIENNLIRNCVSILNNAAAYCIWIDFANQGTRITRNFLEGSANTTTVLFLEADMGPTLFDNNIVIESSGKSILSSSGGSIFANNLFINAAFNIWAQDLGDGIRTSNSYIKHTLTYTNNGAQVYPVYNKMYGNIFAGGTGPSGFSMNSFTGGVVDYNLYIDGTKPSVNHTNAKTSTYNLTYTTTYTSTGIDFSFTIDNSFENIACPFVDAALVGVIPLPDQSIEDKFGDPITISTDFNNLARADTYPKVGPLENIIAGTNTISIGTNIQPTAGVKYTIPVSIPPLLPQAPLLGIATKIPGSIEAENYDVGGEGVSFHDDGIKEGVTTQRPDDKVDIGAGGSNGFAVAWFSAGEWLEYTVDVEAGNYTIDLNAASVAAGGTLTMSLNGKTIASINVPNTTDWNIYKNFKVSNINLEGTANVVLRIISTGGFNLDKITFVKDFGLSVQPIPNKDLIPEIYPNPVTNTLNVRIKSNLVQELKIYNFEAKLLLSEKTNAIDVSKLKSGMYILKVNDKQVVKFIKN